MEATSGLSRRDLFKTIGVLGAGVGATQILAACSAGPTSTGSTGTAPGAAPSGPKVGGELRIDAIADPLSLDPLRYNGFSIQRVYRLMYNGLLQWKDDGKIEPDLAADMPQVSADGLTYTFKLKQGVKWHDGKPFDSADVKFSYDTVMVPGSPAFWAASFRFVESVTTPDASTVVVKLKEYFGTMLGKFALVPIVSSKNPYEMDKTLNSTANGTGAYKFVEWVRGDRLVLQRNPEYHDAKNIYIEKITFKTIPENATRVTNLVNNVTQLVVEAPNQQFNLIRQRGQNVSVAKTGGIRLMFYPNFAEGRPTRDVNLRLAIQWAMDRQAMIDQIFPGAAVPAATYLSNGTLYFDEKLGTFFGNKPDLTKARDYLQKAGGAPSRELLIVVENSPDLVELVTIAQANLKAIGVNSRISAEDVASYFAKFPAGDYDLLMFRSPTTTAVGFDSDYVWQGLLTGSASNLNRFSDTKMDGLLTKAVTSKPGAEAQAAWKAVQEYDVETLGQLQILTVKNVDAYAKSLQNYSAAGLPWLANLPGSYLA